VEDDLAEQIWRRAPKWSKKIWVVETARAKTAVGLPQRGQIIRAQVPHERPMGVALDTGKMNIGGERNRDFKVGTVFDITQRVELDPLTQEIVAQTRQTS
jgi:hypothetical protein